MYKQHFRDNYCMDASCQENNHRMSIISYRYMPYGQCHTADRSRIWCRTRTPHPYYDIPLLSVGSRVVVHCIRSHLTLLANRRGISGGKATIHTYMGHWHLQLTVNTRRMYGHCICSRSRNHKVEYMSLLVWPQIASLPQIAFINR